MSRTDDGGPEPQSGRVRAKDVGPRTSGRPKPDQPLRARWDPTDDSGRPRVDRESQPQRKMQSSLGRFVSNYGWRAYAIPVLAILTVVLIVVTVRDSRSEAMSTEGATPDLATRNTDVSDATRPIGAPTVKIDVPLPAGSLPVGGEYTRGKAGETFRVLPGTAPRVGTGQEYTYTVEVEKGLNQANYGGDRFFAQLVDKTLANPKSWTGDGKVSFRRIDSGEPDLRVSLTSASLTRKTCGYQIKLESSCFYPPTNRVILNEARWVRGAMAYDDGSAYRQYLINHEVGHGIGYEAHEPCHKDGALAPIMMQQSFGVANRDIKALDPNMQADPNLVCKPNPWPYPTKR